MVSMQDIADRLGVSRSTVSLVLSGKAGSRVSEEMKKKVFQTARELDYHINEVARSLRTGSSRLIAVIVTDISNEFFGRLAFHIQEEAKRAGYMVLTINTNENPQEFEEMVSVLIGKQVDGIIAVPPPGGEASVMQIQERGMPVVTVDRPCKGMEVDYVGIDNYASARQAVENLLDEGLQRISLIALDLDVDPLNDRQRAYTDALRDRGLEEQTDIRLIPFGREKETDFSRILHGIREKDALFFTSRRAFTQSMVHMKEIRGGIPEGQCLLCFDDVEAFRVIHPDLRYVEQPVEEMACKSFDLLMNQIRGDRTPGRYIFPTRCVSEYKNSR